MSAATTTPGVGGPRNSGARATAKASLPTAAFASGGCGPGAADGETSSTPSGVKAGKAGNRALLQFGADGVSPPPMTARPGAPSASIPGTGVSPPNSPPGPCASAALFGRCSPDGKRRLSEAARRTLHTPEAKAARLAAYEVRNGWSDDKQAQVRQWVADGLSGNEIARRLGSSPDTVRSRAKRYGIDLHGLTVARFKAGGVVLLAHYVSLMPMADVLALYQQARGFEVAETALISHAHKLGLRRPTLARMATIMARTSANARAVREQMAPRAQALINDGVPGPRVAVQMGISYKTFRRMTREGLVTLLPRKPKERQVKPKVVKPIAPPKPRKLPASWVRQPAPPPKPKPTYETVEAWLAAGNQIKRCPAVAIEPTQARISDEDRAQLATIYAARAAAAPKGPRGAALKAITRARGRAQGWLT